MTARPYRPTSAGLDLFVRVTPNAGADRIEGVEIRDDGSAVLRVRVRAVPDRGRANRAVIALVAAALRRPGRDVSLVAGATSRSKTLRLAGDAGELAAALAPLLTP